MYRIILYQHTMSISSIAQSLMGDECSDKSEATVFPSRHPHVHSSKMDKIGSNVVENERLQQQAMAEAIVVRTETQNFLRKQLTTRALLAMIARRTLTRTKLSRTSFKTFYYGCEE